MPDSHAFAAPPAHRLKRISRLEIPGGGQVVVQGDLCFVGHMEPPHGTSIIDVSDPSKPRILSTVRLEGDASHTHKVRVVGDVMVTNVEQNNRHFLRKGARLAELEAEAGRSFSDAEAAKAVGAKLADVPVLRAAHARGYRDGGFKVYDISDPTAPREIFYQRTHGFGVHRFDLDARYAYMSTEMEGYVGNILVVYDMADPARPREISRWWMPGQHLAGGEVPTWKGYGNRLHHTLRKGDTLYASCWFAGLRMIDVSDISAPRTIGAHDYHPWVKCPTHTFLPVPFQIGGREIAVVVDEEHTHEAGGLPAHMWIFDVTDPGNMKPLSTFHVGEADTPWARAPGRFGAHQPQEHMSDTLVYVTWFSGGLRVVDIADPTAPREVGSYVPDPVAGQPSPQSNDVEVDHRGLVYLLDREAGLDILEFQR